MLSPLALLALHSLAPGLLSSGRTLYLSPTGDDAADGRSQNGAWKSLARVQKEGMRPGDSVVLLGGGTYEGHLEIRDGDPKRPITIRSEGARSTIVSTGAPAITVRAGGVQIRDLILRGTAKAKSDDNEGILLAAPKDRAVKGVRIERVEITGMGAPGISVTAEKGSPYGVDDLKIKGANIHGNYGVGIISADGIAFDSGSTRFAHHDWTITDCDTSENFDGAGIILSGVDRATVEFCRSANNTNPTGGGLGMWAWCARRVTFRHDIASGIRSKGDGGGFDLDGGTVDCAIERCLSFDNYGPGAMHCDFPSAPRTQRNSIRDNVSVDDGRAVGGGPTGFGFVVWGSGLYDCRVERNLVVLTKSVAEKGDSAALFATFIRDDKAPIAAQRLEGAVVRDNTVLVTAPGTYFVRDNFPAEVKKEIVYERNAYRGDAPFVVGGGEGVRRDLPAWRAAVEATAKVAEMPGMGASDAFPDLKAVRPHDLPTLFRKLGR